MKSVSEYVAEINAIEKQIAELRDRLEVVNKNAFSEHSPITIGNHIPSKQMGGNACTAEVIDYDVRVMNGNLYFTYECRKVNKNGSLANIHCYESFLARAEVSHAPFASYA